MRPRSVSIAFQTDKPLAAYGELAALAEGYGFDTVSVYNDMLYQPAWLPLLEMARATRRVRLGPAAVNPFTSHPINIAGNLALLDEASSGRAYLGLARGAWLDFLNLHPAQPVTAVAEAFALVRHLLRQSREPFAGRVFRAAGGDALRWDIVRPDIPFMLGTWGPALMRACIGHVSEIKLGGTANPDVVQLVRTELDKLARTVGRDPAEIGLVVGSVTVVAADGSAARALARREVALYAPVVARLDRSLQLAPELLQRMEHAAAEFDHRAVAELISDKLLGRLAFAGAPDEVAAQAAAVLEAGAARVEFGTPHGMAETDGLRLLGECVLPAIRH